MANYTPFLGSLSKSLQDIAKVELSWSGHLAAFKMILLPQLLYLFRTLPIPVPHSFFPCAQSMINRYLWQGKRARCAFKRLIASRRAGGVGHVLLKDYRTASILSQAKSWFPQSHDSRWLELEKSQVPGNNLYDLLLISNLRTHTNTTLSPMIVATLQAWRTFSSMQFPGAATKTLPLTISSLALIIPDLQISHWISKGIKQ